MGRSIAELAREALAVQDACNLCGVAQSFARAMVDLGEHTEGTNERNTHPVAILWADKIAHLTGTQSLGGNAVMKAFGVCRKLSDGYPCDKATQS